MRLFAAMYRDCEIARTKLTKTTVVRGDQRQYAAPLEAGLCGLSGHLIRSQASQRPDGCEGVLSNSLPRKVARLTRE